MKLDQFLAMEVGGDSDDVLDLRGLEYVSSYDDHLMCPICHCPFVRPVRLGCDHVFCQACLNIAIHSFAAGREDFTFGGHGEGFTCPTCRTPTRDVYLNVPRLLTNMCDDLPVRCPYSNEGCEEIVPRGHIQTHADKYCGYKLISCPSPDCDQRTRKKDLSPEKKCLHELHKCLRCEKDIMEQDYEVHRVRFPILAQQLTYCLHTGTRERTMPKSSDNLPGLSGHRFPKSSPGTHRYLS